MKNIKDIKKIPISEYTEDIVDVSNKFLYIDKSFDDVYNYHLYYFNSNERGDYYIIPGYDIDKTKMSFEEYIEYLRDMLILDILEKEYNDIFDKYDRFFQNIKNNENLYPTIIAFKLMLISENVSEEDKKFLIDYKIFENLLEIKEIKLKLSDLPLLIPNEIKSLELDNEYYISLYENKDETEESLIEEAKNIFKTLEKVDEKYGKENQITKKIINKKD